MATATAKYKSGTESFTKRYTEFSDSRTRIAELRQDLRRARRDANIFLERYIRAQEQIVETEDRISFLKDKKGQTERAKKDQQRFSNIKVQDVWISGNSLFVRTKPLVTKRKKVELGRYTIEFNLPRNWLSRVTNEKPVTYAGDRYHHPHIAHEGDGICWGGSSGPIMGALARRDYPECVALIIDFLENARESGGYRGNVLNAFAKRNEKKKGGATTTTKKAPARARSVRRR